MHTFPMSVRLLVLLLAMGSMGTRIQGLWTQGLQQARLLVGLG